MIDPRFANGGAVPFVPGYGAQQIPFYQHQHQQPHPHHHHKNKNGGVGDSPVSRDESIHKVDHGHHHHFQQNDGTQFGGGYGVPYGAGGFQPQQQFVGGNYGYGNQYQGNVYDQGIAAPHVGKHRRRHHRHHHQHAAEAANGSAAVDQAQGVPEQLIGQRSSSVLGNEEPQVQSPHQLTGGSVEGGQPKHRRHRRRHHHHHHHSDEQAGHGQTYQSHQGHTSASADGYGHINDDLIFIERGEHSPHRQEPPAGYEYKGKIEVQSIDKEHRSHSQGQSFVHPSVQPVGPPPNLLYPSVQPVAPSSSLGPCPPGWQQMVMTAAPGGPCPPGGAMYAGQLAGHAGIAQAALGGIGGFSGASSGIGFGGVGPIGAAGSGGGLDNLAASLPFPPQGQLIADYIVESNVGGVSSSSGSGVVTDYQQISGSGPATDYQQSSGSGFSEHQEHGSSRATIIEVWQKRSKSEAQEKSHHTHPHTHTHTHTHPGSGSRSPKPGPNFDFERFRNDILGAIERMAQSSGTSARIQWTGHDGGTQTQIHPSFDEKKDIERRPTGGGEVRVIVQPIQPVFYMPRQNETTAAPHIGPVPVAGPVPVSGPGPAPAIQQSSSGGPHVVYVPRNVYVPVIKPVFVPRERVIVRPQVIHVARPVLVDRPVPVTQRPIIIDRERPIPVPVRGAGQAATQAGGTRSTGEEYVYRDNLPVAYGGRTAEYTGGANFGYIPSQQEHQYAASSTHEAASGYQTEGPTINLEAPEQYQHSQSASQLNVDQGAGSFHESYANLARTTSASGVNVAPLHCTEPIEVFNTTVNASYQHSGAPRETFNATVNASYQNRGAPMETFNTTVDASFIRSGAPMEVLDAALNPNWQRTDKTSLVRRYGRPAYDIVQRTDQVEQQMYQELRQRSSSGGIQRSDSAASYGSASGIAVNTGGGFGGSAGSYSSLGDIQSHHQGGFGYQSSTSETVCVNY